MFRKYLICILTVVFASACSTTPNAQQPVESKQPVIVTSIAPVYSMVAQLVDEDITVHNIISPHISEHVWTASPADIQLLAQADVVVINGILDQQIIPLLDTIEPRPVLIDTSTHMTADHIASLGMKAENHTHEHDEEQDEEAHHGELHNDEQEHHHEGIDPHFWLSPTLARTQVAYISEELQQVFPEKATQIATNQGQLEDDLTTLASSIAEEFHELSFLPFMDFHPAYGYFYQEFHLDEFYKGSVQLVSGRTPTTKELQELYKTIRTEQIQVLFTEPQFTAPFIDALLEEFPEITVKTLNPTGTEVSSTALQDIIKGIQTSIHSLATAN